MCVGEQEALRLKKEKEERDREKNRLLLEIERDKQERMQHKGVLPAGHGFGGIASSAPAAAISAFASASFPSTPLSSASSSSSVAAANPVERIDTALGLVGRFNPKVSVPALQLLLQLVRNVIEHPDDAKYRYYTAHKRK